MDMPQDGKRFAYGPQGQRIEVDDNRIGLGGPTGQVPMPPGLTVLPPRFGDSAPPMQGPRPGGPFMPTGPMDEMTRRRVESGQRLPTMRIVKGLSEAFSSTTKGNFNEPVRYESWVADLVDLGERVRIDARSGPGRWAKR